MPMSSSVFTCLCLYVETCGGSAGIIVPTKNIQNLEKLPLYVQYADE